MVKDRSGISRDHLRPFRPPVDLSILLVHSDQVGIGILIAGQNDVVPDQNRRSAEAIKHVERPKRKLPPLLSVGTEREESKVLEKDVDVRSIRSQAGGAGMVRLR